MSLFLTPTETMTSTATLRVMARVAKIPGWPRMGRKKLQAKLAKVVTADPKPKVAVFPTQSAKPNAEVVSPLTTKWSVRLTPVAKAELPARFCVQVGEKWYNYKNDTTSYTWEKAGHGTASWKPFFYSDGSGLVISDVLEAGHFDPRTGIYSRYEGSEHVFRILVQVTDCQYTIKAGNFERSFIGVPLANCVTTNYDTLILTEPCNGHFADWVFDKATLTIKGSSVTVTAAKAPERKDIFDLVNFVNRRDTRTVLEVADKYDGKVLTHNNAAILTAVTGTPEAIAASDQYFCFVTAY